jgi:hypothetical protein
MKFVQQALARIVVASTQPRFKLTSAVSIFALDT